jgi:UDP-N-acetylglucosamine acyltransferase
MPGVLMIEARAQGATGHVLAGGPTRCRADQRGVDAAKFRRQVVPGDSVRLEVRLLRQRARVARARGTAFVGGEPVAEANLVLAIEDARADIHPTAHVHTGARIGAGSTVGPNATVGRHVTLGRGCSVGALAVVDGWTEIGDGTTIYPFASIGLAPQDLKYRGGQTRLVVGRNNVFREFVTIHRGTEGGGGLTSIGDNNLFMAYSHVAHDCHVGCDTIFGNGATLGGHVEVGDYATISAFSGVHPFCRVARHAFIGGYSVVTKDALPFAKTVGNRARIYGLNTIGLRRRGFSADAINRLRKAFRFLLQSKLNTRQALALIERTPEVTCDEVAYLVEFIRTSRRGVILRRASRSGGDDATPEE